MSGLNEKPIVVNLDMDKETTDYIAKHDYIKVGDKEFISRDRAKLLIEKLANGVTTGEEQCSLPVVVQQRELLTAFMEYLESIPEFPENEVLIENFIVEGGL